MRGNLGVQVVEGFFNAESAPTLGHFDVVHMNNVLEHIPDPISLVSLARDLLEPGGIVCINVPNDFSPFQLAASARAEHARMVGRAAASSELFRLRLAHGIGRAAGDERRRAHDEFPDGSVRDDG